VGQMLLLREPNAVISRVFYGFACYNAQIPIQSQSNPNPKKKKRFQNTIIGLSLLIL
jgi:hypothetical protein